MMFRKVFLTAILFLMGAVSPAAPNSDPFPTVTSKKGLQVQMVDDALALGIKHAALNFNLGQMVDLDSGTNSIPFAGEGEKISFARPYMEGMDRQVKALSSKGVIVSLILLNYQGGNEALNKVFLHPTYERAAPNRLAAFNTISPDGTRYFKACLEFLAQRYSRADAEYGRVWNYIVGNEVNSHWFWCNMGRTSMEDFADDYLRAVRLTHQSIRKHSRNARVYLSLEHHWNIRYPGGDASQTFAGKPFLEYFARKAREGTDFDWHIAFHPYPENLFEPRTWNDKSATFSTDTPRITFKNIEVLLSFLKKPDLQYDGKPRRVILSEQGFHTPDAPDSETVQAAAYCYAYFKIKHLDGIDSFILHRHVDHGHEGDLNLGLWTRNKSSRFPAEPDRKKKIYDVFRLADTAGWEKAFEFALPVVGVNRWEEIMKRD